MGLWEVPWLDKSKIMKPSRLSSNGKGLGWATGKFQVLSPNGGGGGGGGGKKKGKNTYSLILTTNLSLTQTTSPNLTLIATNKNSLFRCVSKKFIHISLIRIA